jgi:predicted ATP-grasp superfamily ATP-dependent carboligase
VALLNFIRRIPGVSVPSKSIQWLAKKFREQFSKLLEQQQATRLVISAETLNNTGALLEAAS